jgi:S-adenosylmethionine:tRNA ribosyltransferase-isomerase
MLESREPRVDTSPARADEIDEQREVVDARVALRELIRLQSFKAADRLVEEPPDLGNVPCNRQYLGPDRVAHSCADLNRYRALELGRCGSESLDLLARTLESSLEVGGCGTPRGMVGNALFCAFQSHVVHGARGYSRRRMDTSVLDYELPRELIAQSPAPRRDASRLLVYRRSRREVEHRTFSELPALLAGELAVLNDTRVVPARLRLRRESGGEVEVLLVEQRDGNGVWEALARPSRRLRPGERLGPVELREPLGSGRWLVRLEGDPAGEIPLPPYIHEPLADPDRYQTVYAHEPGSAAAPTAGLHFTTELLARLDHVHLTLHVGLDTFQPVTAERLEEHPLHGERFRVDSSAWERIEGAERVLAVGTSAVRVIETVARSGELEGRTSLFVRPGFDFLRVGALLTNFHLPRSTTLALVMAFVGVEETLELYRVAIAERYRFYSFGDAMLVL